MSRVEVVFVVAIAHDGTRIGWKLPIGRRIHEGIDISDTTEYLEDGYGRVIDSVTTTVITLTTSEPYTQFNPEFFNPELPQIGGG